MWSQPCLTRAFHVWVSHQSHTCPLCIIRKSHVCLQPCLHTWRRTAELPKSGQMYTAKITRVGQPLLRPTAFVRASLSDRRKQPTARKTQKNQRDDRTRRVRLCGGLKGPGAAPGAGDFKGTCRHPGRSQSPRRPHRRSRWDWTPRSKPAVHPKQKAALGRHLLAVKVSACRAENISSLTGSC